MPECHSGGDCPSWYNCNLFELKSNCPYIKRVDVITDAGETKWIPFKDAKVCKYCNSYFEKKGNKQFCCEGCRIAYNEWREIV